MPLQVKTLKSALFHLANLSVARARPISINQLGLGDGAPGRWEVYCSGGNPSDPDARYGFFVDFDEVAVSCWVDNLTRAEMDQAQAAYDHNVATLYPYAMATVDCRQAIQAARKKVSNDLTEANRQLQDRYFGEAKRNGTSMSFANEQFSAAIDALKPEDMLHWSEVEAAEQRLREIGDLARPGMVDAPSWIDYMNKTKAAGANA